MFKKSKYGTKDIPFIVGKISPAYALAMLVSTVLSSLIPAYQTIAIASFSNTAIEIFNGSKEYSCIFLPLVLLIGCFFVSNLIPIIVQLLVVRGRNKLEIILKSELLYKKARLEYQHIENNESWGLIGRVCKKPTDCFLDGFDTLLGMLNMIITTLSLLVMVMVSSVWAGVLIVIISMPFLGVSMRTGKENYAMQAESQKLQRRYNYLEHIIIDRDYAEERTLFNYSNYISRKYEKLRDESYQIEKKLLIKSFVNLKSGSFLSLLAGVCILGILLNPLINGEMSVGLYIALVTAVLDLVQNMSWQLSWIMFSYAKSIEYMQDFTKFINMSEKVQAIDLPAQCTNIEFQTLEFKDVSFSYPGTNRRILNHCSFRLEKGKSYAFVGENGAGKTTIVKLLTGLYDNYEGVILINDIDIKSYPYGVLKKMISVVHQDFAKFPLSIKENICLGDVTKTDESILEQVCEKMGLKRIAEHLDQGLDTKLGKLDSNGTELSGGQWQRVAIARLMYANSPINILDEPTAALDPLQESAVYELFQKVNDNQFTIYITHRLGAARIADEILVIKDGAIFEQGTHKDLMSRKGNYEAMFMAQKSWYR